MTGKSFVRRAIDVTLRLGEGTFGEDGSNTVKISGARIACTIAEVGGVTSSVAEVRIYGLTENIMNKLSAIGVSSFYMKMNTIVIEAGDYGSELSVVYTGQMQEAYQMLNQQPETYFQIKAAQLYFGMVPTGATSIDGEADVGTVMQLLGRKSFTNVQNHGVNVKINNLVLNGSIKEQIDDLARQAHIGHHWDRNGILHIYPHDQDIGGQIPLISPATGLIGYPDYIANGIKFRTLFNPAIVYRGKVKFESSIPAANREWEVTRLSYDLAAEVPGGPWFCDVEASLTPGLTPGGSQN